MAIHNFGHTLTEVDTVTWTVTAADQSAANAEGVVILALRPKGTQQLDLEVSITGNSDSLWATHSVTTATGSTLNLPVHSQSTPVDMVVTITAKNGTFSGNAFFMNDA